jgi:hypothetical protein
MNTDEARVWHAFQRANAHLLTGIMYNVHVGTFAPGPSDENVADQLLRAALYAKRIDAVALTPEATWIIEVKTYVRPSALGQLLTYMPLLPARFPTLPPGRAVLVAAAYDTDAAALCATLNITCAAPPFTPLP